MPDTNSKNIAAVIVTFHPDHNFENQLDSLLPQVNRIVIVDNTADSSTESLLSRLKDKHCHIIKNPVNFGIARALNQGIAWISEKSFTWVLTLDQDTHVHAGLIELYIKAIRTDLAGKPIGVINTVYRDVNTRKLGITFGNKKNNWTDVPTLITSGSFFSIETYKKVGPFRENFFLDWADHDFCLRARSKGLKNYIYKIPFLDHKQGSKTEHKILFTRLTIPTNNHSPFRCYLISHNLTILLKENYLREFRWAMILTIYLMSKFILVICFEKKKILKTQNLCKGFVDGLMNNSTNKMIAKYQNAENV